VAFIIHAKYEVSLAECIISIIWAVTWQRG